MKKWFIRQELSKTDEEHIVEGNDAPTDEDGHGQSETNSLDSRTQPPPRGEQDLDKDSGFVYCGQDEPKNAPSETEEEYGRKHNVHQDDPSRRKQFMRLFVPDAKPSVTPQVWAGVTAAATHLGVGSALGLSTASIPLLTTTLLEGDDLHLSTTQAALFNNVVVLGAAVGSLVTVVPQVWVGQRVTLLAILPVSLASWIMLVATNNAWVVVAARALQGLTLGIMTGPANNYVVELAHTKLRATLLAGLGMAEQLGWFVMRAAGTWALPWRWVALGCGCLSTVIPFAGLLFLPDSPRWLAFRDRPPEALKSLMFFRGPHYSSHEELTAIFNQVKKRGTARDQLRVMEDPNILNIILLLTLLHLAVNFTGNLAINNNTEAIFTSIGEGLSPTLSAVLLAAVSVIGSLIFLVIVERTSRRLLLAALFLLCFGALAMLGSYFYDHRHAVRNTPRIWLPIISLAMFSFVSSPGMSILILLREELLPTSVRVTAVGFLSALFYTGAFVAHQTYQPALAALEQHGLFWLYSCFNLLIALIGGLALRETRGRSLEKIASAHVQSNNASQKKNVKDTKKHQTPVQRDNNIHHISTNGYHDDYERGINDVNRLTHSPRRSTYVHRKSTIHQAVQTQDQATETHTDTVHYMIDGSDKIVILNLRNTYV